MRPLLERTLKRIITESVPYPVNGTQNRFCDDPIKASKPDPSLEYNTSMLNRPETRNDQAWQLFLALLLSRRPEENPFNLAQDAFRATDAFEQILQSQERDMPEAPDERRGF